MNKVDSKIPYVYILASKKNGAIYVGVTSNLIQRTWQHKNSETQGHTSKYHIKRLVYFEKHESMEEAIIREKQIKAWKRQWKINLIEKESHEWKDLWEKIIS